MKKLSQLSKQQAACGSIIDCPWCYERRPSFPTKYGFDRRFGKTSWHFSLLGQHNSWRNDASWTRSERPTPAPCSQREEHDIKCKQNDLLGLRSKYLEVPCRLWCDQAWPGAIEAAAWTDRSIKQKGATAYSGFVRILRQMDTMFLW